MTSDLLTLVEVAAYLSYADRSGALRWLRAHDVRMVWRGKRLLIRKADIDRALDANSTGDTVARARKLQRVG